uniref:Uncharacterized protein n=1 Tax=Caenorhabditis japonica TaxID=281687 RepID=A0A8R1HYJ3_CAEJA
MSEAGTKGGARFFFLLPSVREEQKQKRWGAACACSDEAKGVDETNFCSNAAGWTTSRIGTTLFTGLPADTLLTVAVIRNISRKTLTLKIVANFQRMIKFCTKRLSRRDRDKDRDGDQDQGGETPERIRLNSMDRIADASVEDGLSTDSR